MKQTASLLLLCALAGCASTPASKDEPAPPPDTQPARQPVAEAPARPAAQPTEPARMELGNFSVSLAVKDLKASREFYEKLGFRAIGGDPSQNWLILQNQTATIGLFQGMFEKNMLTFNPGWDRTATTLKDFQDVREIQKSLKEKGITPVSAADESTDGPASFVIVDPDGNPILLDQHIPRPKK